VLWDAPALGWQAAATSACATLLLAMVVDLALGDPRPLYRVIPHPVAMIGQVIAALTRRLNRQDLPRHSRILRGAFCTAIVVAGAGGLGAVIHGVLTGLPFGWVLEGLLASSLLAYRGLYDAVKRVASGLSESLEAGRAAVSHIVGRDPASLDAAACARAAAESAAENFSDGFVAPVFWFLLLGLPGLLAYKAINTLDSMIGHRDARFEAFGKVAARLDDAANYLPARLAGLILVLAAMVLPTGRPGAAWRAMLRDAPHHRSPNAGWQEAALAGALGFALAGPRQYGGQKVEDHWMGDGRRELTGEDLNRVLDLYLAAGALVFAALSAAVLLL
jgi:adenosylcobinamide-phosphate synthase